MTIRVLRLLEYTYPDTDAMDKDMAHWGASPQLKTFRGTNTVRVLMMEQETIPAPAAATADTAQVEELREAWLSAAAALEGARNELQITTHDLQDTKEELQAQRAHHISELLVRNARLLAAEQELDALRAAAEVGAEADADEEVYTPLEVSLTLTQLREVTEAMTKEVIRNYKGIEPDSKDPEAKPKTERAFDPAAMADVMSKVTGIRKDDEPAKELIDGIYQKGNKLRIRRDGLWYMSSQRGTPCRSMTDDTTYTESGWRYVGPEATE